MKRYGIKQRDLSASDDCGARAVVIEDPGQLPMLRASLLQVLTSQPTLAAVEDDEAMQDVVIVATELTSNALKHGRPLRTVQMGRGDGCLVIDVVDHDPSAGPRYEPDRPVGRRGLGLRLVLALAADAGWCVAGTSKHMWAALRH